MSLSASSETHESTLHSGERDADDGQHAVFVQNRLACVQQTIRQMACRHPRTKHPSAFIIEVVRQSGPLSRITARSPFRVSNGVAGLHFFCPEIRSSRNGNDKAERHLFYHPKNVDGRTDGFFSVRLAATDHR